MLTKKEYTQIITALNGMKLYDIPNLNQDQYKSSPYISLFSIMQLLKTFIEKDEENNRNR